MRGGVTVLAAAIAAAGLQPAAAPADAAFAKYWDAKSPAEAAKPAGEIVKSGATFDEVYPRLQRGRVYAKNAPTGAIRGRHGRFEYWLNIPAGYDAARKYQVRIQLHGGVMRPDASLRGDGALRLPGAEQIYISPAAWNDAPWWSDAQIENLRSILDIVKRTYNVDENRVVLSGVSDGGTGAFYVAMRDTTPYASFLPLNGYVLVLRSPQLNVGDMFLNNLRDKPLFVVNGGKDPLYPVDLVEPSLVHLNSGGVPITYRPQLNAGHDTSWWPQVKDEFETFVRTHPRTPLPDTLTWETSDTHASNRAHWLVIDSLGATAADARQMTDLNRSLGFEVFHNGRSGRVDLTRAGNTVTATTRGVKEFTLLLSPEQFDFSRNVKVVVNGHTAFDAAVEKSVATLTKWAAHDNDRTLLFGAEIKIRP
jgi:poly(3-hydroxybutyrate) depolymerase